MSDVFAEATVRITPSTTGFKTKLETDLKEIMDRVKVPPVRVRPALTKDFLGDLRTQVNTMIERVQKQVKPIRVRVLVDAPSRRQLAELANQAPISVGAVAGHVAPRGAGAGGASAETEARINNLLGQRAVLLGGVEVAEDRVTKGRKRGVAATKAQESVEKGLDNLRKRLKDRPFVAAQATGELGQAKRDLKEIADIEAKALELRKRAPSAIFAETRALHEQAVAERQVALERVQSLEKAGVPGTTGPTVTKVQKDAVNAARRGADTTKDVVAGLRETDAISKTLTNSTKHLSAQQELLGKQQHLLSSATKVVNNTLANQNVVVRESALNAQKNAQAQVNFTKSQIAAARESARSASAEKRRSEQLSRGGQASILSLAGIRGATLAASRSFLVGAASITVFARAVKQFADLERNIDVFRATTSATAAQMEQVQKAAIELGADLTLPAVSAGDAAGAMVELAKAGLSVQDAIDGARGVLELSTAAAIDNADAVRLVANVLNAFQLSGKQAAAVADTLANSANLAQGSIADVGTAFQQAASAGHQVGLSFQDTSAFLTILAKNGLRGSDAGTSLRTALIRLINPSTKAQEAFNKLGIVLRDSKGNLRPDVFLQLAAATSKLGPAQRDATLALVGGQDAFRAVTILGRQSVKGFLAVREAMHRQGTAAELAKARTEGLHGAMDGLQSVLETVGTNLAGNVDPAFAKFVRSVSSGITGLSENQQVISTLNQTLSTITNSFTLLGKTIGGIGSVLLRITDQILKLANAVGGTQLAASIAAAALAMKVFQALLKSTAITQAITGLQALATAYKGVGVAAETAAASTAASAFTSGAKTASTAGLVAADAGVAAKTAQTAAAMETGAVAAGRLGTALSGVGRAGAVLFAAMGGWVTVAIAAAGALYFLSQRENSLDRANRHLAESSNDVSAALDRQKAAEEGLASARRSTKVDRLGVEQAKLNLENAQVALSQGSAVRGSTERRQLLLNVAIATQNVTFATQDYKKSLDDLVDAQQEHQAASAAVNRANEQAKRVLDEQFESSKKLARFVFGTSPLIGKLGAEKIARLALVKSIRDQAQADSESTSLATQNTAKRERLVALVVEKSKKPLDELQKKLGAVFTAPSFEAGLRRAAVLFGVTGKKSIDLFIAAVTKGLEAGKSIAGAIKAALEPGVVEGIQGSFEGAIKTVRDRGIAFKGGSALANDMAAGFKATFDINDFVSTAEAEGLSTAQILAKAQSHLPGAQKKFNRLDKATKGGTVFKDQAQQDAFNAAKKDLLDTKATIESLTGDITSAAKDQTQKIKDAQDKRDAAGQAVVDSVTNGRKATQLQRKITTAGLTEWLGDDLKTNQAWLIFLKKEKDIILARLKKIGASKKVIHDAMVAISGLIFDTTNEIKKIGKDIKTNTEARKAALLETALTRFDLRIRIAQARDDVAAEIKIRRQKVAALTVELHRLARAGKKNTIAWLEIKAQQQEEIAAINDLTATQKKKNQANQQLQFEFLQTIQGFSANLIGNLIPFGVSGGLVSTTSGGAGLGIPNTGSTSSSGIPGFHDNENRGPQLPRSPGKDLSSAATAESATRDRSITRGQGQTTNHLLRMILAQLAKLNRGMDHPEATHQRKKGAAAFDYGYQGPGM